MVGYYAINPMGSPANEDAFGPRFFKSRFYSFLREACVINGKTPVLELFLTSGHVLDVSHIIELKDDYMLVSAFEDVRDCTNVYHTYIRYVTIYRINVLMPSQADRPMGFNVNREPTLLTSNNDDGSVDRVAAKKAE